jgi:hypothetical protein
MMGMMSGPMSGWMIAWMVLGAVLSLAIVASIVFVMVAAGRWLWFRGGPSSGSAVRTAPPS